MLATFRILPALLFFPLLAQSADYAGQVIAITDGDTLRVLYRGGQLKVRLAEIDTPESKQPYGARAKQELSEICFGKQARVVEQDRDRYGRLVGRVYCFTPGVKTEIDANSEMVRRGAAWVYRQYARDQELFRLEQEAREVKRGLWSLPEAQRVAPWEWRSSRRLKAREAAGN